MKRENLDNIMLKDTIYYNNESSYVSTLKKHNITTVSELLNNNILDLRFRYETKIQLLALINMLKYKYLKNPLPNLDLMDNEIDFKWLKETNSLNHSLTLIDKDLRYEYQKSKDKYKEEDVSLPDIPDIILLPTELFGCNSNTSNEIMEKFRTDFRKGKFAKNTKLIDFIKWSLTIEYSNSIDKVHLYAKEYIKAYEQKRNKVSNKEKIDILKLKLYKLLKEKEYLDKEIEIITAEINNLSILNMIKKTINNE